MNIKTNIITISLLALSLIARAQEVSRTEFSTYSLRKDAASRTHSQGDNYIEFAPSLMLNGELLEAAEQSFSMPQSWVDTSIYLHLECVGSGYTLFINGRQVVVCDDSFTPRDYDISQFVRVGDNVITLVTHTSNYSMLEESLVHAKRKPFEGSYIFTQNKLKILDYSLSLTQHTEGQHGQLFIDVIVENRFNFEETIDVGFDIYAPDGKLLDFSSTQVAVAGNSIDTIRFAPHLYGAEKQRWNPSAQKTMWVGGRSVVRYTDQPLYSVMLFTKRNRVNSDYIPFEVGFILPEYSDGTLSSFETQIDLRSTPYRAVGGAEQSEKELRELKQQGFNTIIPDYPQPLWFYYLCDKLGLYVIDQAAISAPTAADQRAVGGTPSNNPELVSQYLDRVQSMYFRTRNFSCVVGYSLGHDSGNGYNMYKAYQWLKGVAGERPVIYSGAKEEWNSDPLKTK
ncbi:MAG: glycoside hydrolase family 2 TIM barrel-domain containing protein [Rikenellaceae bacterium]